MSRIEHIVVTRYAKYNKNSGEMPMMKSGRRAMSPPPLKNGSPKLMNDSNKNMHKIFALGAMIFQKKRKATARRTLL